MSARRGNGRLQPAVANSQNKLLTGATVHLIDRAVNPRAQYSQFMLVNPAAKAWLLRRGRALVRNTEQCELPGYTLLCGRGKWFPELTTPRGEVVAWCGDRLAYRASRRMRQCFAHVVMVLRPEVQR